MGHDRNKFTTKFFQHLDTPMMIFIFESDEFILGLFVYMFSLIVSAIMGIVISGGVLIYAVMAILSMYAYMRFKKNKPNGYTFQRLYRMGLMEPRSYGIKALMTKKQKSFKVLPYGFITKLTGN